MATRRDTQFPNLGNTQDLKKFNPAVKQIIQSWMGNLGDGMDKVLTLQDMANVGLLTTRTVNGKTTLDGVATGVLPTSSSSSTVGVLATPGAPTGLTASGALGGVNLSWDASSESYYAYTEILRASVDDAGLATVVGKSIFNVYRDELWSSASFYYWIRFVNSDGVTVKTGPLNAVAGTSATVGEDPAFTLSVLASQITESELYGALNTRIDLIDTPTTGLIDRMTSAESGITANDTDILALQTTVNDGSTGVAANAAAVSALDTRVTTAEGNITVNASDITALETTVNDGSTGVAANASAVSSLDTRVTTAEGNITANASDITTLQSTVGSNTSAISTEASTRATADGLLNAEYTIKADVNGHIAGMGVAVSGGASGPITSDIIMLADRFSVGLPASTWSAAQAYTVGQYVKPTVATGFIYKCTVAGTTAASEPTWPTVLTNTVVDGGVTWETVAITETIPFVVGSVGGSPAVVIDTAIIADASIGSAKIGDLAADKITTGDLVATLTINGGAIYGGVVGTSSGSGYRSEMSAVDSYMIWAGNGAKNDANAVFFVKNDGTAQFNGVANFTSGSAGYANITDKPTSLSGINSTEGTKLSGIANGADVTSANTAAAITGQGALATASSADWSTQVSGTGKPANNADVTSANTSADTSAVNGLASSSVSGWAHATDTTKIDGGDIYTGTVTANAIAANTITGTEIFGTKLSGIFADLGNVISGTMQSSAYITTGSFLTAAAAGSDTTLNLVETSDFATSGSGQIVGATNDRDTFSWTGKTSTTLTGCSGVLANPAGSIVVPGDAKTVLVSNDLNEIRGFGDRGDGTKEETYSIGIKQDGSDIFIADFGSANTGNDRVAVRGRSYGRYGGRFTSELNTALWAYSTSYYGLLADVGPTGYYGAVIAFAHGAWGNLNLAVDSSQTTPPTHNAGIGTIYSIGGEHGLYTNCNAKTATSLKWGRQLSTQMIDDNNGVGVSISGFSYFTPSVDGIFNWVCDVAMVLQIYVMNSNETVGNWRGASGLGDTSGSFSTNGERVRLYNNSVNTGTLYYQRTG